MNRLTLNLEQLRVDSFAIDAAAADREWLGPAIVTTLPRRTCPECANTGITCD